MTIYAKGTTVSVEKSKAEIEHILARFGADQFSYARDDSRGLSAIEFRARGRHIRFVLTLPPRDAKEFTHNSRGLRADDVAYKAWEQACRERWRALVNSIKAKLAAVDAEISEFEDEFLAHIVLPNQNTVSGWLRPQIAQAYLSEEMPRSLLALPAPARD